MSVLTYNGKAFSEFNTFFDGSKAFGSPEKDYDIISIAGRSGDLSIYNGRFKDITLPFPCFIRRNFIENFRNLTEYLNKSEGYLRLETSDEPQHFRKALFQGIVEPTTTPFNHSGKFTINFRCHPQRWLKIGERAIRFEQDGSLFNPTLQTAKPLIRVYGTGTVTVNGVTFTITQAGTQYVDVDCDIYDAYEGSTNMNGYITGDFPELKPGNNTISISGCTIDITPRWFEV